MEHDRENTKSSQDNRLWWQYRGNGVCEACNRRHTIIRFAIGESAYKNIPIRSVQLCENCSYFISEQLGAIWCAGRTSEENHLWERRDS